MRIQKKNNILWYSKSYIIDRDQNALIFVWRPAGHWRAPDWLSLTCCRCDVIADQGGGGGDGGVAFGGKCIEEVRWDHSGLRQGTGGVLEPGPRGTKGQVRAHERGYKTQYSGYDVGGVGQLVDGGIYTSVPRTHLFVTRELVHHEHLEPSITFILLRQHTWMFWSPWLREAAWKWVF